MKPVLIIFVLIGGSFAASYYDDEYTGFCKVEGIILGEDYYDDMDFTNKPIFDDHVGPILKVPRGTVTEVEADDYDNNIAVSIQGDEIVFELVKSLENFDYNTVTDDHNITLDQEIIFRCPEGYSYVYFYQTIADRNNHKPTFNRKIYTYKFGMDIAAGFELTSLLDIIVVDLDFTDHKITFSTDGDEYLEVKEKRVYINYDMGKTHFAQLKTIKDIKGPFNRIFNIFAEDINHPRQIGKAEIHLIRV